MITIPKEDFYVTKTFANFRKLCECLNIPYRTQNNSWKKNIVEELECYFTWETKGQKIIITNIYEEPLPRQIRDNDEYFFDFVKTLITQLHEQNFNTDNWYIRSATEILNEVGLFNDEHLLINQLLMSIDTEAFDDFLSRTTLNGEAVKDWNRVLSKITFETIQLSKYLNSLTLKGYCSFTKELYCGTEILSLKQLEQWEICKRTVQDKREHKIQQEFILNNLANRHWLKSYHLPVVSKYKIHWNSNIYKWATEDGYISKEELIKKRNTKAKNYIDNIEELENVSKYGFRTIFPTKAEYEEVEKWLKVTVPQ